MPATPMPHFVSPMLTILVKETFDSPDSIFEPKLDGYRAIGVIDATGNVRI
jgi:ATP-dependent DNA ligase